MTAPITTKTEDAGGGTIRYKRAKFSTRLYKDRVYTPGHAWLLREAEGPWRVGLTKFAARMLGDPVELDYDLKPGAPIETGQEVGWLEGFKAVSDLYAPMPGIFLGGNPALATDLDLFARKTLDDGWLFRMEGEPGPDALDLEGYMAVLDAAIDKMLGNYPDG